jgi:hypothetical protein
MTTALELTPTIDLAQELASITQRQHLNDVHYMVQLIRHALAANPLHIHVRSRRRYLEIEHDGQPLSEEEHGLLLAVTNPDAPDRQPALVALERRFGVALLSVLVSAERVVLSGRRALSAEGGWVRPGAPVDRLGSCVRIYRRVRSRRQEREELRFYCRYARIPITLNGRTLNADLQLDESVATTPVQADDGAGIAAIPRDGALHRVRYFKHGIYFGVRSGLPDDGRPIEAVFDSSVSGFEDNFRSSVANANAAVARTKTQLYRDFAASFPALSPTARARAREIVLGLAAAQLPPSLTNVPIIHTSANQWRLSLRDLETLAARRGYLPYLLRPRDADDELPVLSTDDVAAIARLIRWPVRHALTFVPERSRRDRWRSFARALLSQMQPAPAPVVLAPDRLSPDLRALLAALHDVDRQLVVRITRGGTEGGQVHTVRNGGNRTLYVPHDDPELLRGIERYRSAPDDVDLVAAALLQAA